MHHITITGTKQYFVSEREEGYCERNDGADGALIMAWAGEKSSIIIPDQAGIRILGRDGWKSFGVQTHWNNPNQDTGISANSGVRVWYTKNLRAYDVGVMQIGDPGVVLNYGFKVQVGRP